MIVVIIAGGSGTRLWPLSTPDFPKQLLKVDGQDRTLLQQTYDRARSVSDKVYVVPEQGHVHHVRDQLPELTDEYFIVEPGRRGTANCIIAALQYIAGRHDNDEPIACISADHYIRDVAGFKHSFMIADQIARSEGRLVLVGVEPDYPATGFGYIEKGKLLDEGKFVFNVKSFKEKPDHATANEYVNSGNYLWNCGYFVGSVNTFKQKMETYAPQLCENYTKLEGSTPDSYDELYLGFSSVSIDYALIEKVEDLLVVPAAFDWMDLGSFADMHKAVTSDDAGNHIYGKDVELEEVENSFIQNHESKPVAVIGLDNVVVVNTPHGILVARKDLSQKVGDISKRFKHD
ncbi:MAG TPA: mannose-1-phosphate guanylyltransferase [Candidatus Saccharimonadales bacterium]|jgi:mannose-1-phosphate guanylyltransferase/mannose-6-phosphate isomerase